MPDVPNPAAAAAKASDSVTIFSNGVAHLRTHAAVPKGKDSEFNLPFKQSSMEDVLASFTTFGKVAYTRPASFTQPTKKSAIKLGSTTFESLTAFRGTKVKAQYGTTTVEGTLFNTDTVDEGTNSGTIQKRYVTILTTNGLETIPWAEVKKFEFTEPEIKAEIEKALASSRQALKPDAVFLNVGLKSKDESDQTALFQWVEQLSPWSLSYRLNRAENGSYKLDAFGVIHNTTDSDWKDTIFTLVTGKPLTFISDLDKQRTVQRTTVNIQDTVARGGYIPEDGILLETQGFENQLEAPGGGRTAGVGTRSAMRAMPSLASMPQADMGGAEMFGASNFMGSQLAGQKAAPATTVTAEEVGDFCVYKQDAPLTIPANTTASLPLFSKDMGEASQVLIYDPRKNQTRPFRAIKFKNETEQTLGMGVCVVFEKNLFQGKCVMNASKPGEQRMLYYAEETGVAVKALPTRLRDHRDRLMIGKGVATARTWQSMTTTYTLRNVKNEEFTILVEYQKNLDPSSECKAQVGGEETKATEELQSGLRYAIKLPAKGTVTVVVTEKFLHSQAIEMVSNTDWFIQNFVNSAASIRDDKKMKGVLAAKKKVDDKQAEITASNQRTNKANQEKGNLTQVLNLGANAGNQKEYQDDLKAAMTTLKTEGAKMEKFQTELAEAKAKLYEEIAKLQGEWAYTPTDEAEEKAVA